jgi:DNA-directed RNA polymerase specialized sigma24 family protein
VDEGPFETWYRGAHPRLLASLVLVTGSVDEASECVDEALARALGHWRRVSSMASPDGWTYRVALNVARRRARRRTMEATLLRRRAAEPPALDGPAGEAWAVVAELPLRQRQVVVLRYVADLTEGDIAAALGISRSTVSSTLADARRALGRLLADDPLSPKEVP